MPRTLRLILALSLFAHGCGDDEATAPREVGVPDVGGDVSEDPDAATTDVPTLGDTSIDVDRDPDADTMDVPEDEPDIVEVEDAPECIVDAECGEPSSICADAVTTVSTPVCVDGTCAVEVMEVICEAPDPRCDGDAGTTSVAACDEDHCGVVDTVVDCSGTLMCVDGRCEPAPPYPADVPFKGIRADGLDGATLAAANTGRVLVDIVWADWQPLLREPPCPAGWLEFDGACFVPDTAVETALRDYADAGLTVSAIVRGTPEWARTGRVGCPAEDAGGCASDDPATFARFVAFLSHRHRGPASPGGARIDDWIIGWHANDMAAFSVGSGGADTHAAAYADQYWAASTAIRSYRVDTRVYAAVSGAREVAGTEFDLMTVLNAIGAAADGHPWSIALDPSSERAGSAEFSADDTRITFGTLGEVVGSVEAQWPTEPPPILLVGAGFSSLIEDGERVQRNAVCDAYRQALATPGVIGYIVHRYRDDNDEVERSLQFGLADFFGVPRMAWTTWSEMDVLGDDLVLECGFELGDEVEVRRFRNDADGTTWSTSRDPATADWVRELPQWRLLREWSPELRTLYDCVTSGTTDHFVSLDPGCGGAVAMGPIGNAYGTTAPDRQPLYRCVNDTGTAHILTERDDCEGLLLESNLGYGRIP